ncbi:DUF4280 domain-containing protein [Clostridium botulinum]|uniref:DUF4280 domain-containing protein n=1 Tax=Clostridium botulinum TaxID=1491 RepID=UPI00077453DF|nr:DUF4280 domain-containing protein [Clostridium botulinum]NFL87634.1 DUF4280 domain-containing protein [Clostridium botulinum]NFO20302.1 DUF4280 domain-containing protein [Clostridium botulinum]HBJ1646469.1 DUF4280 domain-containing protein [Clostridium botulinum]
MSNENEEKYGEFIGTVKNELEKGVKDTSDSVTAIGTMAKNVGGYLKRDVKNGVDWLLSSKEEKQAEKEKEKAEEEQKKKEEEDAQKAEEARLAELQNSYILHTAVILCSYAARHSFLVVPQSHGEFIHGIPQLNIEDSKPNINIISFGVCRSPQNPNVQAAAKEIAKEIKERKKTFTEKVLDLFAKKPSEDIGDDLVKQCAGKCEATILTPWIDGKEDVLIDGKQALLGKCKLECKYGGDITIYTSGQITE